MQPTLNGVDSSSAQTQDPQQQQQPEPVAPPPIQTWTSEQRTKWLETGERPKPPEPPKTEAPAAPQKPSEAPDGAESDPDSEPGDEGEDTAAQQQPRPRRTAQTRIRELVAEKKRLEQQVDLLLRRDQPGPQTTEKPPESKVKAAPDGKPIVPNQADFTSWDDYDRARTEYLEKRQDWLLEQRERQQTQQQQEQFLQRTWSERQAAAKAAHKDYQDVVSTAEIPITHEMRQYLMGSPEGAELVYHLAKHPDLCEQIAVMHPIAQIREMTRIGLSLMPPATKPAADPPKTVTAASRPPTELSARSGSPEDEAGAALKARDFATYRKVMNSREIKG